MSIDHSYTIANDGIFELKVNISGLDKSNRDIKSLSAYIYATCAKTGQSKFTCSLSMSQLAGLHSYLDQYEMIKDESKGESGEFIQVKKDQKELVELLLGSDHAQVLPALRTIIKDSLSNDDINTILGRKDAIKEFEDWLSNPGDHTEPEWQKFLEKNEWIFGYGLRYRYLAVLQRECYVSGTDLDGKNSVIADFLMSDARFTKLVELKRPDTPLFKANKNRSESWQLSGELTDAVSQILCQKANWELESQSDCYKSDGKKITESTCDVDCILLIGTSEQFSGDNKEAAIKRKTIELYRRNMRNIEILFFDELLERARFIVEGSNQPIDSDGKYVCKKDNQ
jgi:hypothetical protein